ncbi:aminotransferase class V-fold PLP-dependent enzyme [Candidatus Peregrinibacteria bacterium]|nr:aminotransferase class V-fold PLP-dependent enzyme [Candidatus Peregrinibacteria bacterium]
MIYLDYAAATPLRKEVIRVMKKVLEKQFGNPSSAHSQGRAAKALIEAARSRIAQHVNCKPTEVVFTGGGTEANNMAILGFAEANIDKGNHIITTPVEHESVLEPIKKLQKAGFSITFLPVDSKGAVSEKDLLKAIKKDTVLISIIHGNNEIGTVQDIKKLAESAKKHTNAAFHTDSCQTLGYNKLDFLDLNVDAITINSGKISGPKGVGALILKEKSAITPFITGGGQERRLRSGTENLAGILGFAEAVSLIDYKKTNQIESLRGRLQKNIIKAFPQAGINGDQKNRLPNNLNVTFPGIDAESLLIRLDMEGIAASAGSACGSGSIEPSHVLLAIGLSQKDAKSTIRFSLGDQTTKEEIDTVFKTLNKILKKMYNLRP